MGRLYIRDFRHDNESGGRTMGSPYERPPSAPPPNYAPQAGRYTPDLVIGILLIIFSACGVLAGLFLGGVGMFAGSVAGEVARQEGLSSSDVRAAAGIVGVLAIVVIAVSILNIFIGIGFIKSMKWAFIAAIVVNGLSVVSSFLNFNAGSIISLVIAAGLIIYSAMRLAGNVGPKPV